MYTTVYASALFAPRVMDTCPCDLGARLEDSNDNRGSIARLSANVGTDCVRGNTALVVHVVRRHDVHVHAPALAPGLAHEPFAEYLVEDLKIKSTSEMLSLQFNPLPCRRHSSP